MPVCRLETGPIAPVGKPDGSAWVDDSAVGAKSALRPYATRPAKTWPCRNGVGARRTATGDLHGRSGLPAFWRWARLASKYELQPAA